MIKNLPITIILALLVGGGFFVSNFLNDDYFIDKQPDTEVKELENIMFTLINDNKLAIEKRISETQKRLAEIENQDLKNLTDAQIASLQAEKDELEKRKQELLELENRAESEKLEAQQKEFSSEKQMSELIEENAKLGAEYSSLESHFDEYVSVLENSALGSSDSDEQKSFVRSAFQSNKGLEFLRTVVGSSQEERSSLSPSYWIGLIQTGQKAKSKKSFKKSY